MSSFCTAKATHIFSAKNINCVSLDVNFKETLTNDIVSFEQLGPDFYAHNFEEVGRAYYLELVRPSGRHTFQTSHIFGTMYARILKLHICIAYEKLAAPCFLSFLSDSSWWS